MAVFPVLASPVEVGFLVATKPLGQAHGVLKGSDGMAPIGKGKEKPGVALGAEGVQGVHVL